MRLARLGLCLAVVSMPWVAAAQGPDVPGACRADVQALCAEAQGAAQTMECLLDHQKEMSLACYDALKARLARQRTGDACRADVQRFCSGAAAGGGRVVGCLVDHQKEISDACYESLRRQKTGAESAEGSASAASPASAPPPPIYRSRQADGGTLYSDTVPMNGTVQQQVPRDRINVALPLR